MRHFIIAMIIIWGLAPHLYAVDAQDSLRPPAAKTYAAEGIKVELFSPTLKQGRAGIVRVSAQGLSGGQITIFDTTSQLFSVPDDPAWYALIAAPMEQTIRTYEMTVTATFETTPAKAILVPVEVASGEFLRQDVTLPPDPALLALLDPLVEQREFNLLDQLTAPQTPERYWGDSGFTFPVQAELTSPFGLVRNFNEVFETRHTGWDFTGELGDLMLAMADGRVVFSGNMDIRGGYVLIDHGHGVYSGYAHQSVIHVVQGQFVRQGQLIGLAGSTGRSSSPHLHMEMQVNGKWIDPVDFVRMWVP